MKREDYSDWIPDPKDIKFDRYWHLLQVIAFLVPTIGVFFFIIHMYL